LTNSIKRTTTIYTYTVLGINTSPTIRFYRTSSKSTVGKKTLSNFLPPKSQLLKLERNSKKMVFSCCRCIIKLILTLAIIVGVILAAIFIGAAVQKGQAKRAPDISPKYQTSSVCAFKPSTNSTTLIFQTYATDLLANASNATVGQCGDCGQCSYLEDYEVLAKSSATELYKKLGYCGLRAAAGSSYVSSCLSTSTEYPESLTKDLTTGCNGTICVSLFITCFFFLFLSLHSLDFVLFIFSIIFV